MLLAVVPGILVAVAVVARAVVAEAGPAAVLRVEDVENTTQEKIFNKVERIIL